MPARAVLAVVAVASMAQARNPEVGMVVNVDRFSDPDCTQFGEVYADRNFVYDSTQRPWLQIVVTNIDADGTACWGLASPTYYDLSRTTARWRESGSNFDSTDRNIPRLFQFYKQWNITTTQVWWRDHTCSNDFPAPDGDWFSWGYLTPPATIGGDEPLLMDKINTARPGECVSAHIDDLPSVGHPLFRYIPHFGPDNVTYLRIASFQYVQLDLDGRRLSTDETNEGEDLVYDPPYFYGNDDDDDDDDEDGLSEGWVVTIVVSLSVLVLFVVVLGLWALSRRSTNAPLSVGTRSNLSAYPNFASLSVDRYM